VAGVAVKLYKQMTVRRIDKRDVEAFALGVGFGLLKAVIREIVFSFSFKNGDGLSLGVDFDS